jgi:hypothetical protein
MLCNRIRSYRPQVQQLEDRLAPAGILAAGADGGGLPQVRLFDALTGSVKGDFLAYDSAFRGGVHVAVGDVNGDGVPDYVTAPGVGGGPHIKAFNGRDLSLLASFLAYDPVFKGGVNVAVGDVNGDGIFDIITGAGTGGGPHVRVFDIIGSTPEQIAGPLGSFFAYDASFRGGVNVAAGNLDGVSGDELITGAGTGGGPHVKAFAASGATVASFLAYNGAFAGGVYVAAGDLNDDGHADIVTGAGAGGGPHVKVFDGANGATLASFLAYNGAFTGGVRVASADLDADGHADLVTGPGPGGGPHQRYFDGQTLTETTGLLAFDAAFHGGITVGSTALDTRGDPAFFHLRQEIPSLDRLARFVPSAIPSLSNWITQSANDATLDGKRVYVIAHGWAPGFIDMVDAYAANNLPNPPLKWWQTLDTSLPQSPGNADSPEMFYGSAGDGIQISPVGLAYAITQADPNAVVLAYSWIDESATGTFAGTVPKGSYLSEAYTAMNGSRLANALQSVLPANFATSGGAMHLIGHSHGSKVATVAAVALDRTGIANYHVTHLTILDSPENGSLLVSEGDSANNLWYFLGALNAGRTGLATFVDNYISEFDNPLGTIQGVDPLNTSQNVSSLQQIVDVNLNPGLLFYSTDFGSLHAYAFNWYGGASLPWAQNPTPTVANQWSPLINPATPATLAGSYSQQWSEPTGPQFTLTANGPAPGINTVTDTPTFTDLSFTSTTTTAGATFGAGDVSLSQAGGDNPTFAGKFSPESEIAGISFNFRFTNVGAGDQLVISATTGALHGYEIHYVMTGTVAGTGMQFGTLSLGYLAHSFIENSIQIQLVTAANSGAQVVVSNMQQFEQ